MFDVLVAGGGLAGVSAAVAAARSGVSVVLIEKLGYLGGLSTAGLVNPFMSHTTSDKKTKLVAGLFDEIKDRLSDYYGIMENCFDPEAMKQVLLDMVSDANIEIRFSTAIVNTFYTAAGFKIRTLAKGGYEDIQAKRIIDATGDGDVAAYLGCDYGMGGANGEFQAVTLMFDMAGVDTYKALSYVKNNPDDFLFPKYNENTSINQELKKAFSPAGYISLVKAAKSEKQLNFPGDFIFFISRPQYGVVTFNQTHTSIADPTNAKDITKAEIECRYQMLDVVRFCKEYVPGFENAYLLRTADLLGIRESRRIMGEYILSETDVAAGAKQTDCICRLAYPVDVHASSGEGYTESEGRKKVAAPSAGDWYEIPFRSLLVAGVKNVLTAGRCISATREGQGAARIMPACIATGEAAGVAAAISVMENKDISDISSDLVISELRRRGALV